MTKKRFIPIVLICLFTGAAASKTGAADGPLYVVASTEGGAFLLSGDKDPVQLDRETPLYERQSLRTGPGASVRLSAHQFIAEFHITENSSVTLSSKTSIFLASGSLSSRISQLPPKSTFEIRTPAAAVSVAGTAFSVSHDSGVTSISVDEGAVAVTPLDASGTPSGDSVRLEAGESAQANASGLIAETAETSPKIVILDSQKSYYMVPSCRVEDNVGTCKSEQQDAEPEQEYKDFAMYIGDESSLPARALLPWPESALDMRIGPDTYKFRGPMIVCVDYDNKNKKIRVKFFQARADVAVSDNGAGSEILAVSRNLKGLSESTVSVAEGSVAVTTPWFCKSCDETKTYLVVPGECFRFRNVPKETDEDMPILVIDIPRGMDSSR